VSRGRPLAVVTGATSGIGAAFARALAARGYDLLLTGRRRQVIEAVASGIREGHGAAVEVVLCDLAVPADLAALEERVRAADGLAMLVNNAGYGSRSPFLEDTAEGQAAMLRVHAEAVLRLCHAAAPRLEMSGGGAIINVASAAAFLSNPSGITYSATKMFVVRLSESLAMALRGRGIRVQALCPGMTRTDFHERIGIQRSLQRPRGPVRWMTAEQVVERSLAALARGRVVCVPGLLNRLLLAAAAMLPRRLYYAAASRVRPPGR
jgi:short-subunit dehydrogenase